LRTERAIFISGEINDDLVATLTPRILQLTKTAAPITAFVDSDGGSVRSAEVIRGLLRTPSPSGVVGMLATVVTGRACSAAADLLAAGDYVAAYPHAAIHFHGTSLSDVAVSAEGARGIHRRLLYENSTSSLHLAGSVFPRLLSNYGELLDDVRRERESSAARLRGFGSLIADGTIDVPAFAYVLAERVRNSYGVMLLRCLEETGKRDAALKRYRATSESARRLSSGVRSALGNRGIAGEDTTLVRQLALLDALVIQCIKRDHQWRLSPAEFGRLEEEFWQLQAVADGDWQDELLDQLVAMKDVVMSPKDRRFIEKHPDSELSNPRIASEGEAIVDRAYAKLEPLWSFAVALCDALNSGENPMSPEDAWWLGLIDEVIGTPQARRDLPGPVRRRLLAQLPISVSQRFY
jgi:ATP-dependent protease ClpP protease subunit